MRVRGSHVASLASAAVLAVASGMLAAQESTQAHATPERLPLITPAIVEYRWRLLAPQWSIEPREVVARRLCADAPPEACRIRHARLHDRAAPHRKRRRIQLQVPRRALPNECRTTWRDVYVEVPVPVMRRDYVDVDVPEWSWQDWSTIVDVPRLAWKEETLVVSLPALAVPARTVALNPILQWRPHDCAHLQARRTRRLVADQHRRSDPQRDPEGVRDGEAHRLVPGDRNARPRRGRPVAHFQVTLKVGFRIEGSAKRPERVRRLAERLARRERRGRRYTSFRSVSGFLMIAFCRAGGAP